MATAPLKKHKKFDDDEETYGSEAAAVAELLAGGRAQPASESSESEDDDEAPEAVSTSQVKLKEIQKTKKAQLQFQSSRAAQRKANRARDETLKTQKKAKVDKKGKGRLLEEEEIAPEEDSAMPEEAAQPRQSTRLDPSLFAQADEAFEAAKKQALIREQVAQKEASSAPTDKSRARKRKFSQEEDAEDASIAKRVIGNTTVQQLAPATRHNASSLDLKTALPSKAHEKFVKKTLYKAKKLKKDTKPAKSNRPETPLLLFDPLLDKKPEQKGKKVKKALNRIELEEQRRGRRSAQTAFVKAHRLGSSAALRGVAFSR